MYYIGIDPGTSGGIVFLNDKGEVYSACKMPDTPLDIANHLSTFDTFNNSICCIERVHGMPGMSGMGMFTFGQNFGHLQMALLLNKIKTYDITPQKWMKHFQLQRKKTDSKTDWKNKLKAKAQQLYPSIKVTLNIADALLIATYCYNTYAHQKADNNSGQS